MKKIMSLILVLLFSMLFIWPLTVTTAAISPTFTVTPVLPNNQRQSVTGYFDLQVSPGQQEDLQLRIANQSDQTQTYRIAVNPAYTTNSGVIAFDQSQPPLDQNAIRLSTLIKGPRTVTVAANSEQTVTYQLQAPAEHFIGIIAGGFYVLQEGATSSRASSNGVQFTNRFAIGITTILRQDLTTPNPPLLDITKASIGTNNHTPVVKARLHNPSSNQFGEIATDYILVKPGSQKPLLTGHFTGLAVAPHSFFTQSMPLNETKLAAGTYALKWTAKSGSYTWSKQVNFRYNGQLPISVTASRPRSPSDADDHGLLPWIIAGITSALLIIVLGLWRWNVVHHRQNQ